MNKIVVLWHRIRLGYYSQLAKDCMDKRMELKLLSKANYHELKLLDVF